ncbi:class I SAM-dependent methyltransferase [Streptomyces sp. NPDC052396]|uniref:class I SAM-dependent methyltransferase n=1 Tax=Streptomyces sp. NPDC052396 TaxID=3365689 RepID=UPI0037CEB383
MTDSWDTIADWYARLLRAGSAIHDFNRDVLLEHLPEGPGGRRVLDLGCAESIIARTVAARGASVVGIDPSPRMIEHARAAHRVVGDYLAEGFWRSDNPEGARRAGSQHRTLSRYLTALTRHGFILEATTEPVPNAQVAAA